MFGPNHIGSMPIPTLLRSVGGAIAREDQRNSAYLDGASDSIRGLSMATTWLKVLGANQDFTIHFSVKLDAVISTIFFSGTATDYCWIQVLSGGNISFSVLQGGATVTNEAWSTGLAADTWYDVVITCDTSASDRDIKCYVNKVEKTNSVTATPGPSATSLLVSGKFVIGRFLNVINYDFRVDRLYSWDAVLTQAEIDYIYDEYPDLTSDVGDYTSSANLQTYYTFEEGSGTTMSDTSGNSNGDLTAINATANFWSSDTRI